MLVRPMIGRWEVPRLDTIVTHESRRLAVLPVPGLSGDLHQDLGRAALAVELSGSLFGDEARDAFLKELRTQFLAGEPVDFVADIVNESELEQVLIESFDLAEGDGAPDIFAYRITLREYTEPPVPPAPGLGDFGLEVDDMLGDLGDLGLDMLDLPGLLVDVPDIGDLLTPVVAATDELRATLGGAGALLDPLRSLLE